MTISFVDLIDIGLIGLRTRPARATLSALGIAIGIATMIVVTGIPASSQAALLDELSALGTNTLQATAIPDPNPPAQLPSSATGMVRRIGAVTAVSAVANTHSLVRRNDRTDPADGSGLTVLAGSGWRTRWSSRCWSGGRRSDCGGLWAPLVVKFGRSS